MTKDEVRLEAERRYEARGAGAGSHHGSDDALEELRIHQIELEIQNEELRRAEQEAQEARRRYFSLYEFAPVGYITVRPDGHILSANLTVCDLAGIDRRSLEWGGLFGLIDQSDRTAVLQLLRHADAADGDRTSAEVQLAVGDRRAVQIEAVRHGGDSVGQEIQLSFTDITRLKEAEERARETAEHNALLLRELDHRVKNNLQLLLSIVMLQRSRSSSDLAASALAAVEDRIRAIVFSHESLGTGSREGGADLVELLRAIVRQFDGRHESSVVFTANVDRLVTDGDAALALALAVNELVSNGLKHVTTRAEGTVSIRLEAGAQAPGSRGIRLIVADSGPGLPAELLSPPRAFASGSSTDSQQFAARGLGLRLVSQLIEQQLGGTWVRRNGRDGGAEHLLEVDV